MAPQQSRLQYITLANFTPGIFADWYSGGGQQSAPDGAAQLTGTYGCVASPAGGLIPAPALIRSVQQTPFDTPFDAAHYSAPQDQNIHITAFGILSPAIAVIFALPTPPITWHPEFPDAALMVFQWYFDGGGTSTFANTKFRAQASLFKLSLESPTATDYRYDITNVTSAATVGGASFLGARLGGSFVEFTRANNASPNAPGVAEGLASCVNPQELTQPTNSFWRAYPQNAASTTDSSDNIITSLGLVPSNILLSHQDRLIIAGFFATPSTFGTMGIPGETIFFTNPNDYTQLTNGIFGGEVFVSENPTGFGSYCSMNASLALFVKRSRGGYILTGPLETPTITNVPGIPGADPPNIGVVLPDGRFIYGNQRGVWAWSGGDSAQLLSPQLDGAFWVPSYYTLNNRGHIDNIMSGNFGYQAPYVFAPKNFLYDTVNKSWWKLNNTYEYAWYHSTSTGYMIAAPPIFNASQPNIMDYYDPNQGQSSYQWTSQPLKATQGRYVDFREVDIETFGTGSVTITLTGLDGTFSQPVTFTCSGAAPKLQNSPIYCKSSDVVVTIQSTSGSTTAAPRVMRLNFGYYESETARG